MVLVFRHRRSALRALVVATISVVGFVMVAGPASAAPVDEGSFVPPTVLVLTVHAGTTVQGDVLDQVLLTCDPPGGTHPHPWSACRKLHRVGGDFSALPDKPMICPFIYAPVTVEAMGWWRWYGVAYSETFGNRCLADAGTNGVFAF